MSAEADVVMKLESKRNIFERLNVHGASIREQALEDNSVPTWNWPQLFSESHQLALMGFGKKGRSVCRLNMNDPPTALVGFGERGEQLLL